MPIEHLSSRAVIAVSGSDAQELLQRVITANIDSLGDGVVRDCALLTPQGKILFQFLISRNADGYLMDCPADHRDALMKRLTLYKLRSDVTFEPSDLRVVASVQPMEHGLLDERAEGLGHRAYVALVPTGAETDSDYKARRITVGVPEILADYDTQSTFAHEALLDLTRGIDFRKGCYVGQEVVSRVEHRSTARKRFVKIASETPLPERGAEIIQQGKVVGTMGSSHGTNGLGLVRVDKLDGAAVEIEGAAASLSIPAFASFTFGATSSDA